MTTTRQRAQARLAARFGKLSRLAVLSSTATATVIAVGVAAAPINGSPSAQSADLSGSLGTATGSVDLDQLAELRDQRVSRTAPRIELEPKPADHKFVTASLNIWKGPNEKGPRSADLLEWGTKVAVTGQVVGRWAEVLLPRNNGNGPVVRWVNADYLVNKKPKPEPEPEESTSTSSSSSSSSAPSVGGVCSNGTSVPSGVSPSIVEVHQAVCAAWPQITTYGTFRAGDTGDHGSGRAVDIMISGESGWAVAEFVRANAAAFGVNYIIFSQKIWSIDRGGEGWRSMEDRGSITANHYDHVHVSVY